MTERGTRRTWARALVGVLAGVLVLAPPAPGVRGEEPGADAVIVDEKTEAVLHGSLKWLSSKQQPSGAWSETGHAHQAAFTAYVLMGYMACGNLPNEGEFGGNVARGAQFLLECVRPDGYISAPTGEANMYGHGIASIALGELYGQTRDPMMRPKLERAIKLIVSAQNSQGGWRYAPRPSDADISVTVLQVVALRAAKNAGIDVPQRTIDSAVAYVKSCYDPPTGGFTYQPHNRQPGFARTAAAIYSLQVCGLYDDRTVLSGSKFLFDRSADREWFTYGNFYAAPAQYMIGGDTWKRWYALMKGILLPRVRQAGEMAYWDPVDGGRGGTGTVYATAVYTLILAMPYHYIPLYQR